MLELSIGNISPLEQGILYLPVLFSLCFECFEIDNDSSRCVMLSALTLVPQYIVKGLKLCFLIVFDVFYFVLDSYSPSFIIHVTFLLGMQI